MNRTDRLRELVLLMDWTPEDIQEILASHPKPSTVRRWLYGNIRKIPADSLQVLELHILINRLYRGAVC